MKINSRLKPLLARHKRTSAYSLVAALLMSTALPAAAAQDSAAAHAAKSMQDLGAVDAAMPMTATVWLKGHNQAAFDAAVADLYDPKSPLYHEWMSPEQVTSFGPTAADVAKLTASLRAQGLKIEHVSEDGTAIKVSGTAAKIQAAFGTTIHRGILASRTVFTNVTAPQYRGANPELVDSVTGLSSIGMRPFAVRQPDFSTGAPKPGIKLADTTNPLAAFTTNCFGPTAATTLSGTTYQGAAVTATYTGPQYVATGLGSQLTCGYTPAQVAAHYGLDAVYAKGWTGKGQTIVIIDAYGSQTIAADANAFSKIMGLPQLTGANFQVLYPDGVPNYAGTDPDLLSGWATETALDVEWAHAMAPDAKIVLLSMLNEGDDELANGVTYATHHKLGDVISNSYGEPESLDVGGAGPAVARHWNGIIQKAAAQGIAVNFSSGDSGDFGVGTPIGAASIPADSQYATAVGGTSIGVPSDNGPVEAAWGLTGVNLGFANQPFYPLTGLSGFAMGSGGGESVDLPKPTFQAQLPGIGRQVPDVSALADPLTGALMVDQSEIFPIGGTSLATPIFSAIWALADQAAGKSLGQAAPIVAKMTSNAIQDVLPIMANVNSTSGTFSVNGRAPFSQSPATLLGLASTQPAGFVGTVVFDASSGLYSDFGFGADSSLTATAGWDNVTGWGVPKGLAFIQEASKHTKKPNS